MGGGSQKIKIPFAIGIKTAEGIFMKFRIWIRGLLTKNDCFRTF